MMRYKLKSILFALLVCSCSYMEAKMENEGIVVGAAQMQEIMKITNGKSIGLVVNQTSCIGKVHLMDILTARGMKPLAIFAPEHGYRGDADAGEYISNGKDTRTGIPIISLYGKNKKPQKHQLEGIDMMIFDIQDAGARFYTYISTLYYVMQACAENEKELLVLDRPNPCDYIDGPVLEKGFKSFVGMLPIPVLHGCTIAEIAQMINGEGWLGNGLKCNLRIVSVKGWKHHQPYSLPIKPSPNLPNDQSIALYPSLCFFEATSVSVGRGTHFPFQVIGSPLLPADRYKFCFTPKSLPGFAKNPLHKDVRCHGLDLRETVAPQGLSLHFFMDTRNEFIRINKLDSFLTRPHWFDLLMGTDKVRKDIEAGKSEEEIRKTWQNNLQKYRDTRKKYLLYEE